MINCQFENGNKAALRHVTVDSIVLNKLPKALSPRHSRPAGRGSTSLFSFENKTRDSILLVKRAPHLTNPNKYALPGGFLGRDEDTETAAKREVLEETGYQTQVIGLFRINDNPNRPKEDRQNVDFVYLLEVTKKVADPDKEVSNVVWFKLDELPLPEEFAFDHYENIELYLKFRQKPFPLPVK